MPTVYFRTDSTAGGDGTEDRTDGATRAYPSMGAALSGEQADLTGVGPLNIICTQPGADTVVATIDGYTTTATDYINIECQGSARNNGVSREKSGTGYQLKRSTSDTINCAEAYVRMTGVESVIVSSTSLFPWDTTINGIDVRLEDCIFGRDDQTVGTNTLVNVGGTISFTNCLFFAGGQRNDVRSATVTFDHCGNTTVAVLGIVADDSATITNTWAKGATSEDFWTGGAAPSGSHNASEDASVSTDYANSVASFTPASEFTTTSNLLSTADFTLKDSSLNAVGTGSLATDIADTTRTGTADIGVFEFAAAGGTILPQSHHNYYWTNQC